MALETTRFIDKVTRSVKTLSDGGVAPVVVAVNEDGSGISGGGGSGGETIYDAFAYEEVTVAAASIGLTAGTYLDATRADLQLETAQVRYRIDGGAPSAAVGFLLEVGQALQLTGAADIAAFRAFRTGGTSGRLNATYSREVV